MNRLESCLSHAVGCQKIITPGNFDRKWQPSTKADLAQKHPDRLSGIDSEGLKNSFRIFLEIRVDSSPYNGLFHGPNVALNGYKATEFLHHDSVAGNMAWLQGRRN